LFIFYPEAQFIFKQSLKIQAERRKKKLVCFLSRGAVYLQAKLKDTSREEKKGTCSFFIPRRSLSSSELTIFASILNIVQ